MVADDLIELRQAFVVLLKPPGKPDMQIGADRLRQTVVGGIADEEVSETETVLAAQLREVRPDDLLPDERCQTWRDVHSLRHEREHEMASSEADVLPYDGENVVLDDLVRDDLLLEIPMIPLCSEDCPGIASASVKEETRPVDPRLAPLLRMKKEKEKE